jgi:tetratricopeptide (TPR) repeat protein
MLDQVIEISPIELSAHLQKSENYFMLGDSEKALFVLEDALNYVNDSPELEYRLTAFYLINGENEKAYHCFDRAFSKDNRAYKDIYKFYPQAQFDRQINSKIKDLSV